MRWGTQVFILTQVSYRKAGPQPSPPGPIFTNRRFVDCAISTGGHDIVRGSLSRYRAPAHDNAQSRKVLCAQCGCAGDTAISDAHSSPVCRAMILQCGSPSSRAPPSCLETPSYTEMRSRSSRGGPASRLFAPSGLITSLGYRSAGGRCGDRRWAGALDAVLPWCPSVTSGRDIRFVEISSFL